MCLSEWTCLLCLNYSFRPIETFSLGLAAIILKSVASQVHWRELGHFNDSAVRNDKLTCSLDLFHGFTE